MHHNIGLTKKEFDTAVRSMTIKERQIEDRALHILQATPGAIDHLTYISKIGGCSVGVFLCYLLADILGNNPRYSVLFVSLTAGGCIFSACQSFKKSVSIVEKTVKTQLQELPNLSQTQLRQSLEVKFQEHLSAINKINLLYQGVVSLLFLTMAWRVFQFAYPDQSIGDIEDHQNQLSYDMVEENNTRFEL